MADDPVAQEVLEQLSRAYQDLTPDLQKDIALLMLPMGSREENALICNALQRTSSIIVQNSVQEGFGLTCTEAMWKNKPMLVSNACGLRQQIRDGVDGRMHDDANNPDNLTRLLDDMLADDAAAAKWARSAERRVYHEFLVFTQLRRWLEVLTATATKRT